MVIKLLFFYWRDTLNARTLVFMAGSLLLSIILMLIPLDADSGYNTVFSPVNLSIVDEDQSLLSHVLINQFAELEIVDQVYNESYSEARLRLDNNEILLVMIIPEGFYEQTRYGLDQSALTIYLNSKMPAETSMFIRILDNAAQGIVGIQAALYAYQEEISPLYENRQEFASAVETAAVNLAFKLMSRNSIISIDSTQKHNPTAHVISTLICLLAMIPALLIFSQIQQERKNGLHERLVLAGVQWWQAAISRVLSGLVWLAASFVPVFILLLDFYEDLTILSVFPAILLLFAITALICLFMAYTGKVNDLMLLAAWLVIMFLLVAGGSIYPWDLLPRWFQLAGQFSPVRWAHSILYSLLAGQQAKAESYLYLSIMLALGFVFSWPAYNQIRQDKAGN